MPQIIEHQIPKIPLSFDDYVRIEPGDEPDASGACHKYNFFVKMNGEWLKWPHSIHFQNGPYRETVVGQTEARDVPPVGVSSEAVLAILLHHLRGFQSGKFPCRENSIAITHLEEALMWLQKRIIDRCNRGVEGRNEK